MRFTLLKWLKSRSLRRAPARERHLRLRLVVLEDRVVPTVTITDPNGVANDSFGSAVAAVGNDTIVGAFGVNGERGAAYLYDSSGNLLHAFTDPNGAADDSFGNSVSSAADGSDVLISADGVGNYHGAVYLYSATSPFNLLLTISDPGSQQDLDEFGTSVAGVGSNEILVGAQGITTVVFGRPNVASFAASFWLWLKGTDESRLP